MGIAETLVVLLYLFCVVLVVVVLYAFYEVFKKLWEVFFSKKRKKGQRSNEP